MGFVKGGDGILCRFSKVYLDPHAVLLRAGKRILTSAFHRTGKAFVKTTKRGFTSLAIPGPSTRNYNIHIMCIYM